MLRSMTAFGRQVVLRKGGELVWELRCVNQRFLEQIIRLPEDLRILEPQVRERITARLRRGKIECMLRWQPTEGYAELILNHSLVEQIAQLIKQVDTLFSNTTSVSSLEVLRWVGVIQTQEIDLVSVQQDAMVALELVLSDVLENREREGARITILIRDRLATMEGVLRRIRIRLPEVLVRQRERLNSRLTEVQAALGPERLEQEMLLFVQRIDVEEEIDRLDSHIEEVRRIIAEEENAGRRLDFLMQELNREANTLGSKSVDMEITRSAVDLKVLIEQMREQIQNIE
ncbi:YicC family protein [Gammaproteobacteria bacterium]